MPSLNWDLANDWVDKNRQMYKTLELVRASGAIQDEELASVISDFFWHNILIARAMRNSLARLEQDQADLRQETWPPPFPKR